jgi:uncharacterized protein (TIGR03083 family)
VANVAWPAAAVGTTVVSVSWVGVGALRAEREEVLRVLRSLSAEEWAAPSACSGWTVHDVAAHLATTFHGVVTSYIVKALRSRDIERTNDDVVAERRDWPHEQVLDEYETWSRRILRVFATIQVPPLSRVPFPIADLGRYPLGIMADALVFDHHCHLRLDVLAPRGPVERPAPPAGEGHMRAVVAWMVTGLPQMSGDGLAWLDRPVALTLTGAAGGTWVVSPGPRGRAVVTAANGHGASAGAVVSSTTADFPLWATRRQPWREARVDVSGDEQLAARFLDSVRVF